MKRILIFALILCPLALTQLALTQKLLDPDAMANSPSLYLELARKGLKWDQPTDPVQIAGPIYFVGTKGLGEYLIKTSEGLILINTGMPGSGPLTAASIMRLGFDPKDLKILLTGHAHVDHVGAMGYLKQTYGAKVAIMKEEQDLLASGGKDDFHYSAFSEYYYEPVMADIVFNDGGQIKLGDVTLTALLTNGHTKGATTFVTNITDNGKAYNLVIADGLSINPGFRLIGDVSYQGIGDNYQRTLRVLESLLPDIWLTGHNEVYNFEEKRAKAEKDGTKAWIDPAGYQMWLVEERKEVFNALEGPDTGFAPPTTPPKPRTGEASRTK